VSSGAWNFKRAGYDATHLLRSRCCYCDNTLRRALDDTESHRFTYSARADTIERDRKGWLQQTPSHSRNRIRQRRCLPLFRYPGFGASRPDVGGFKSALLRFQYQETLSVGFGSAAAAGKSGGEITRLDTATFRKTIRNTTAQAAASLANLAHDDAVQPRKRSGLGTQITNLCSWLWLRRKPRYVNSWLKRGGVSSSIK
jgi:hypothetical protein